MQDHVHLQLEVLFGTVENKTKKSFSSIVTTPWAILLTKHGHICSQSSVKSGVAALCGCKEQSTNMVMLGLILWTNSAQLVLCTVSVDIMRAVFARFNCCHRVSMKVWHMALFSFTLLTTRPWSCLIKEQNVCNRFLFTAGVGSPVQCHF